MERKIAISTSSFGKEDKNVFEPLIRKNIQITTNPYGRKMKKEEVIELSKDSCGIIAGTEILDAEVLGKLKNLKVISRCGVGIENVDTDTAKKLGMKVFNTPDGPTLAVAELTICLILSLLRKVNYADRCIRENAWQKTMGNLLYGKKVGIIGFGRIGKKVAELLKPFNCELAYCDPNVKNDLNNANKLELKNLLMWADIISIHVSSKEQILGQKELNNIKKGSWLLNLSRGGVVDENALYDLLKNNHLSGAAIDVFTQEPYAGSLRELENVILTPHFGSYAKEARIKMEKEAVQNLLTGLGI